MAVFTPQSALNGLLISGFLELFFNGIYTAIILYTLVVATTTKMVRMDLVILGVTLVQYGMSISALAIWVARIHDAFIFNDTMAKSFAAFFSPHVSLALGRDVMAVLMTFTADCVLMWRVFALWESRWKIVLLPMVFVLLSLAFGIIYIDIAHILKPDRHWVTTVAGVYYSATLVNTAISTILIVWRVVSLGGKAMVGRYRRVLEAVVESAVLYSIMLLIYVPFVTSNDMGTIPKTLMLQSILIPLTGLSPALIVLRILLNRANSKPNVISTISTPQFQSGPGPLSTEGTRVNQSQTVLHKDSVQYSEEKSLGDA